MKVQKEGIAEREKATEHEEIQQAEEVDTGGNNDNDEEFSRTSYRNYRGL